MYCPKCGKEIENDAVVCVHCGRSLEVDSRRKNEFNESKSAIGILMGAFLGIIGLIIGICLYPEGTIARKTFLKAWLITFLVVTGVVVFSYIILVGSIFSALAV